jgi:hypothetical protein
MATLIIFDSQIEILKGLIQYIDKNCRLVFLHTCEVFIGKKTKAAPHFANQLKTLKWDVEVHYHKSFQETYLYFSAFFKKKNSKKIFTLPSCNPLEKQLLKFLEKSLNFRCKTSLKTIFEKHLNHFEKWIKKRLKNCVESQSKLFCQKFNLLIDEYGDPLDGFIENKPQTMQSPTPYTAFIGRENPPRKRSSVGLAMPLTFLFKDTVIQLPLSQTILKETKAQHSYDELLNNSTKLVEWLLDEVNFEKPDLDYNAPLKKAPFQKGHKDED